jgi:glycerol-3-phosphate O-acyltransferase
LLEEANTRLALPVPEFALSDREATIDRLLNEPDLLAFIGKQAAERDVPEKGLLDKARQYAHEIGPKFSPFFYFRFAYIVARAWLRLHYSIHKAAVDAAVFSNIPANATVVLVSNHRSNFDPLLITYLASPFVTVALSAGEWARMWPLHHFVRAAGGFVVDRDASDPLYRRVLASYLQLAVASGLHQAFFPEGELTRDGKISPPKLGFLNYYCRACSRKRDIVFVPVGINYDRIPEDKKLAHAEGNFENPKASFLIASSLRYLASVLTLPIRRRSRRYGNASAFFGTPVSLHAWLERHKVDLDDLEKPDRYAWLPELANDLMEICAQQIPALPAAVTATVMCREPAERSWTFADLEQGVSDVLAHLEANNANLHMPGGTRNATEYSLDLLTHSKLVHKDADGNYSTIEAKLRVLQYYANSIEHLVS